MGIFSWIFSSSDNVFDTSHTEMSINPANGLPMTFGIGSLDIAGNPYGVDFSNTNSGFNNGFPSHSTGGGGDFSSGGGSGFDGFGSGNDW